MKLSFVLDYASWPELEGQKIMITFKASADDQNISHEITLDLKISSEMKPPTPKIMKVEVSNQGLLSIKFDMKMQLSGKFEELLHESNEFKIEYKTGYDTEDELYGKNKLDKWEVVKAKQKEITI